MKSKMLIIFIPVDICYIVSMIKNILVLSFNIKAVAFIKVYRYVYKWRHMIISWWASPIFNYSTYEWVSIHTFQVKFEYFLLLHLLNPVLVSVAELWKDNRKSTINKLILIQQEFIESITKQQLQARCTNLYVTNLKYMCNTSYHLTRYHNKRIQHFFQ